MSKRIINLGTGYDTGDGDKLRDGGNFINLNFDEVYRRSTSWKAQTYDVRTTVVLGEAVYVLAQGVTLPYVSVNINQEIINGDWVLVGADGGYDDDWIQPSINQRVRFKGQWVNASYNTNDWVISGAWMGVAKIDTTEPFPPEPSGTPFWLLPSTPTWEDLTLVGDIYQGLEFYGVEFNIVDGFRVWSNGVASETFRLFAYEVSATGATTFLDFIDIGSNLPAGWNVVSLDQFGVLVPNQKYRLILETHADTNTTTLSDNWDWNPAEENPTAGNIGQTTTGLHINEISGNATDQGAFLDGLAIGDDILISESGDGTRYNSYRIIGLLAKVGNVYNYEVTITATGDLLRDGRELDVDFTHKGVAVTTNYNRIVDAWPIPDTLPDQIQGFVTQDPDVATSPTPGLNNNAYGLDLFYETYVLSEDWFYIGIGDGTTNQGGGADIQIVDNLTTQDATVALSGNMGYVLDQKIAAIPTIDLLPYMLIGSYATQEANKVDTALNAEKLGDQLPSNYIQLAGNEVNPMTGMIYGGEVTEDTVGSDERTTTKQMGGFLTYQEIGSLGIFQYAEGVGLNAIANNEGVDVVGIGDGCFENNTGDYSVGVGKSAGRFNTGRWVCFLGNEAGYNNTADEAVGLGNGALRENIGASNIGVGRDSLKYATGLRNTAIGYNTGSQNPMLYNDTISIGSNAQPTQDGQCKIGSGSLTSVRVGNSNYKATDNQDLVPLSQVAVSDTIGEMTGATKASNQVVISEADYGDGSASVTGTLYFIKP